MREGGREEGRNDTRRGGKHELSLERLRKRHGYAAGKDRRKEGGREGGREDRGQGGKEGRTFCPNRSPTISPAVRKFFS